MQSQVTSTVNTLETAETTSSNDSAQTMTTFEDEGYDSGEISKGEAVAGSEAGAATNIQISAIQVSPLASYVDTKPRPNYTDDVTPFVFDIFSKNIASSAPSFPRTQQPHPTVLPGPEVVVMPAQPPAAVPHVDQAFEPSMTPAVFSYDALTQTTGFAQRYQPKQFYVINDLSNGTGYEVHDHTDLQLQQLGKSQKHKAQRQVQQWDPLVETLRLLFSGALAEMYPHSIHRWIEDFKPLKNHSLMELLRMLEENGEDEDYTITLTSKKRDHHVMPIVPSIVITDPEGRDIVMAS